MEDRAPVRGAPGESPATASPTGGPPHGGAPDGPRDEDRNEDRNEDRGEIATPVQNSVAVRALVAVLGFYQRWISPMFAPSCRFHPSCSAYAVGALRTHGVVIGTALTLVRLAKCAPWHPGGLDPVPPRDHRTRCGWPRRAADPGADDPHTEERASC